MSNKFSDIKKEEKPIKFQTEPPFKSGSDQEKMKIWEMKGPNSDSKESEKQI